MARELYPQKFKKIMDELAPNHAAGTQGYISQFSPASKALWEELTKDEKAHCERSRTEWNTRSPPHDVQVATLEKDGDKAFTKFAAEMFRTYGVRVIILGTFLDNHKAVSQFM